MPEIPLLIYRENATAANVQNYLIWEDMIKLYIMQKFDSIDGVLESGDYPEHEDPEVPDADAGRTRGNL